jgi:hypothetical protein
VAGNLVELDIDLVSWLSGLTYLSARSPTARLSLPSTARSSSASIAASPLNGTRIRISRAARWCRWLTMRQTAT